ncbi:phosphonate metabolism transcriptional regulator PhnF [Pseudodesulfovibrio piezophilus]|uniref:Phophonate C-P lyase system transcriptional regulator PhnF, GntR family n=1 Tax=Pseudodesulfovibrio piezophilus (strain DSM 21447 / JCM 15486 / C1TLV30) TaxID=1322246 RepID=M1WQW0_PSEP2|nr:phosphonate metabolism transcriptional regulator PhnF [Pseudodesulfovibrio piezophilus]CCH47907.1 Phophonate C-P lyase system transcriptional regulator PhnF, GntR family [Pseudodesulfovibrio piezophilus C1TLV30]
MLARGTGIALWRQICSRLEKDIASAVFAPGDRLPSENHLAGEFGVNRHTLRRALAFLEEEGLVRIEHGRGVFVREPIIHYPVGRRTRFSENLSQQRRVPGNVFISSVDMEADGVVSEALEVTTGSLVTCITSAGEADGRRINYSHSYFPRSIFPRMADVYVETGSITRTMKTFGVHDYFRKKTRIISRMPTAEEARELGQPKTRPVLITESVNVIGDGKPIEYGVCLFASDWVQIVVESSA